MTRRLHVFTSAAVNYLPKVRMLCRSVRRHHPEAVIHLALADERPPWLATDGEPFDSILDIARLEIPNWRAWSFTHNVVELSTAIKPFALKHLLSRADCDTVLYFDPDIVLFSRVDDILATLRQSNVALTPHQNVPERTLEAVIDNEVASLKFGVFNLGFIGVRSTEEGRRFAEWWAERTYHFCRAETQNGLFTDQKWLNFAPIFFDGVAIIKATRHNVATWNLTTRHMSGDLGKGFTVDGEPLGFYHFTGFDSGAHRIMAFKNASGNSAVQQLIAWYERETSAADDHPLHRWPWAFGRFSDGTEIQPHHRWLYRQNRDLQLAFVDPYDACARSLTFLGWCNTEGRVRYPQIFSGNADALEASAATARAGLSVTMALRLLLAMLAPTRGRALRARVVLMLKTEGLRGIARRLRRIGSQGVA